MQKFNSKANISKYFAYAINNITNYIEADLEIRITTKNVLVFILEVDATNIIGYSKINMKYEVIVGEEYFIH